MPRLTRKQFMAALAATLTELPLLAATGSARAESFPSRPLTLLVQAAPGGAADLSARMIASIAGTALGQSIVVLNQPSAGGVVAVQKVVQAKPDGYTLLYLGAKSAIAESLFSKRPYSLEQDLVPIVGTGSTDIVVIAPVRGKYATMNDLLRAARADNSAKLTIGVGDAVGGIQYLGAELFKKVVKGNFAIVPFGSTSNLMQALQSGQIDAGFELLPPLLGHIKQGTINALAVSGEQRIGELRDVPTLGELGLQEAGVSVRSFIAAPAGTPASIVEVLNKAFVAGLQDPSVGARMEPFGVRKPDLTASVAELKAQLQQDVVKWRRVIRDAKIELQ